MPNALSYLKQKTVLWEALAVLMGLSYSLSLINKLWFSWSLAILSSLIFTGLCMQKRIFAEAGLHLFYLCTAVYGWVYFNENQNITIELSILQHIAFIVILTALSLTLGFGLKKLTAQVRPYLDSFTTVFSMGATLLMINLIPANWIYFIVINAFAIWLYASRKLYLTAGLMLVYVGIAVAGYLEWTNA